MRTEYIFSSENALVDWMWPVGYRLGTPALSRLNKDSNTSMTNAVLSIPLAECLCVPSKLCCAVLPRSASCPQKTMNVALFGSLDLHNIISFKHLPGL